MLLPLRNKSRGDVMQPHSTTFPALQDITDNRNLTLRARDGRRDPLDLQMRQYAGIKTARAEDNNVRVFNCLKYGGIGGCAISPSLLQLDIPYACL